MHGPCDRASRPGTRPRPDPADPRVRVGNDVLDLRRTRLEGKAADARFLARILHPTERALVADAPDPSRALWQHWCCKESAFKVATKLRGTPPTFVHRDFVVRMESGVEPVSHGVVRWEDVTAYVEVHADDERVHAVAWSPTGPGASEASAGAGWTRHAAALRLDGDGATPPSAAQLARLTPREADAVHHMASAAVRLEARAAAAALLGLAEARLEIACPPGPTGRRPPSLLLDGAPAPGIDLSLSHDGAWVAWAVAWRGVRSPADGS